MAYKAGEGNAAENAQQHQQSENFLPLKIATMSTTLPWNPFLVCEIEVSPDGSLGFCCRKRKKGAPCKISIKLKHIKISHQKLNTLSPESRLQSKLCLIAKIFPCA